jgi:N-acetylmuramoyl-L-alanine amidase
VRPRTVRALLPAVACAAALTALPVTSSAGVARLEFVGEPRSESVETMELSGFTYLRLTDLARALGGVCHWNPLTRKMTLVLGEHRIAMSDGNQFVTLDRVVMNVRRPVVSKGGAFFVPPGFVTDILAKALDSEIGLEPGGGVTIRAFGPQIAAPALEDRPGGTAVTFGLSRPAEFTAESRGPNAIDVFIPGGTLLKAAGTFRGSGRVASVRMEETEAGVEVTISIGGSAASYSAELNGGPPRIEVIVDEGGPASSRGSRGGGALGPFPNEAFARAQSGVKTVMIDPGHGGRDTGAVGSSGLLEKDVAQAVAEELADVLKRQGFHVYMTRTGDAGVPVKRRAEIANLALADVFVSIQCDASFSRSTRGFRVSYHRPGAAGPDAGRSWGEAGLARVRPGPGARPHDELLWERAQNAYAGESVLLAELIRGRVARELETRDRGIRGGDLVLLSGCTMPAVLVELGCLTNASDEALLADESFRKAAARAIARGIVDYREMSPGGRSL